MDDEAKNGIEFEILSERPAIRDDEVTEVDVVVEVRCRSTELRPTTTAMNLCLVIDRSGSMGGDKLETAKRSCVAIFDRLSEDDLFTVVTFDDRAEVVINPQTPRAQVRSRLLAIGTGGTTNLSLGWYQGLLELQTHMTDGHHNRLLLLSDGMANAGETRRSELARVATRTRDSGISSSTVGIGDDFQEDLLEAIAASSGGRFWYIEESRIEDIIEEEFRGARTVALDRPRVELTLPSGVTVSRELNSLRKAADRYRLRPLLGQDTFNFAVRIEVDPDAVGAAGVRLAGRLFDRDREVAATERRIALVPQSEAVVSPQHPLVRSVVSQFEMAQTDERIINDLSSGNLDDLREMLQAEIADIDQVRDHPQWADVDHQRHHAEDDHLVQSRDVRRLSLLIAELVEPYESLGAVEAFMNQWRKQLRHIQHRLSLRHMGEASRSERHMLRKLGRSALDLAEELTNIDPDNAGRIAGQREQLRELLADL